MRAYRYLLVLVAGLCLALMLKASLPQVATGTWATTIVPMTTARAGAASVLLPDGRIMIIGGADANGNPLATAEMFNSDGTFSSAPSMSIARKGHAAVWLLDGYVLVLGGTTTDGSETSIAEAYDTVANTWRTLPVTMLGARTGLTATPLATGDVLIAGGTNAGAPQSANELYELAGDSFKSAGALVTPRSNHSAAVLNDGRVLIAGGTDANGATLASTEIVDPYAGSATAGPALSSPRAGATATALLDGSVLVAGGRYPEGAAANSGVAELASADVIDAAGATLIASPAMNYPRAGHVAILLPNNNNVLVAGGSANGQDLASAELYTPWSGKFTTTGSMATARSNATGSGLTNELAYAGTDGLALVAGGANQSGAEMYGFATIKTDRDDYTPGSTVTITGRGWKPGETVTLTFVEVPNIDTPGPFTSVADASGNIVNNDFVTDTNDLDVRFYVTAQGSQSQAQNTFRDNVSTATITSPTTAIPAYVSSLPANVTIAFDYATSTSGTTTATATVQSASNSQTVPSGGTTSNPLHSSLVVTLPIGTSDGKYDAQVQVNNSSGGGANFKKDTKSNAVIVDTTPPGITPNISGTLGNNGWYTSNVTVTWTVSSVSGTASSSGCGSTTISSDTAGTTLTCSATSNAGLSNSQSVTIKRDTTPPTISRNPAADSCSLPGNDSWCRGTQTAGFTASDAMSGLGNPAQNSFTQSTMSNGTAVMIASGQVCDAAGNCNAGLSAGPYKIDSGAPTVTASMSRPADHNDWYNHSVTVAFSVSDAVSGAGTCDPAVVYGGPDSGTAAVTGHCTDAAGNQGSATASFQYDATPPQVLGAPSRGPDHNGWYNHPLHVQFSGTDSTSGIDICDDPNYNGPDSAAASQSGTCTDMAGNVGTGTFAFQYDATAPTVTITPERAADHNGWYNHAVKFTPSGSDPTSGIAGCDAAVNYAGPDTGTGSLTLTCTDNAGNTGNATTAFRYDATPPANVTASAPAPDYNGWYNKALTVTWAGTDSLSGIDSCTTATYSGPDSVAASLNGTCTDMAGNTSAAVAFSFKYDGTKPTATIAANGTKGTNDWFTSNVNLATSATASGPSGATCTADQSLTTDTAGQTFTGSCTSGAGLTSDAVSVTIKRDATKPTAAIAANGTKGNNDWFTSDVAIKTSATVSGPSGANCTADQLLTSDTAGQTFSGSCTSGAGLASDPVSITVKRDATKPIAAIAGTGATGTNGWFIGDVTIKTSATASGPSGVTCSADQSLTTDTTGQAFTGTCTSGAGLIGGAVSITIKRDATPPTVTAGTPDRAADANGWYNKALNVVFAGSDSTSGIASCDTVAYNGPDSSNTTVTGTCTDNAGNKSAAFTSSAFKYDATTPSATLSVTAGTPGTNGWYTSDVTVHTAGTFSVSGGNCTTDQYQATETVGQTFTGSCTSGAGLTGNAVPITVKLDKTPPTGVALAVAAGTLGSNGWYVSDVTVRTTGTDSISGAACTADQSQTTDTTGTVFNGRCTNGAGLYTDALPLTIKRDMTAPAVAFTGIFNGATYILGAVPKAGCSSSDSTSGVATPAGIAVTGGVAPGVGTFTATCSGATDNAGNSAGTITATYSVQYAPVGVCYGDLGHTILQPINTDGASVFKNGSTVPLKFRVCDANGVSIGTTGVAQNLYLVQTYVGTITGVNELMYTNNPDQNFRWDSVAQQWVFNYSTKQAGMQNGTYKYAIMLNDGTYIPIQFGLK